MMELVQVASLFHENYREQPFSGMLWRFIAKRYKSNYCNPLGFGYYVSQLSCQTLPPWSHCNLIQALLVSALLSIFPMSFFESSTFPITPQQRNSRWVSWESGQSFVLAGTGQGVDVFPCRDDCVAVLMLKLWNVAEDHLMSWSDEAKKPSNFPNTSDASCQWSHVLLVVFPRGWVYYVVGMFIPKILPVVACSWDAWVISKEMYFGISTSRNYVNLF